MKQLILVLLLFLSFMAQGKAQSAGAGVYMLADAKVVADAYEYDPMVGEGKRWVSIQAYEYAFGKEVKVNGKTYFQLNQNWREYGSEDITLTENLGLFREEAGKVYCLQGEEKLFFDFTAEKGDTVMLYNLYRIDNPEKGVVTDVKFIALYSSTDFKLRRAVEVRDLEGTFYDLWIDGLGSLTHGIEGSPFDREIVGNYPMREILQNGFVLYRDTQYGRRPALKRNFVEEGKQWLVEQSLEAPNTYRYIKYEIRGDSIINDSVWKKVWRKESDVLNCNTRMLPVDTVWNAAWTLHGVVKEVTGKVFFNDATSVLYDFLASEGEKLHSCLAPHWNPGEQYRSGLTMNLIVEDKDAARSSLLLKPCVEGSDAQPSDTVNTTWIEGVGDKHGPFEESTAWMEYYKQDRRCYRLISCTLGNEELYRAPFFEDEANGIGSIEKTAGHEANSYYLLDGRRVAAPQKGLQIIRYSDGTSRKVLVK